MTFKQLEHVLEIYKAGSVRRAAEQCYITQPALSQQLHRLEQELGFALFDHTASPLRPTAAGEHYLGVVQHIVQQHEQVLQWLRERPEEETGRVILGVTNTRSKIFLPALLPPFQKQHPNIRVVIQEEQTLQRLGELVFTGEVDLALVLENAFAFKRFSFTVLKEEEILLAVPKNSLLDARCREIMARQGFVSPAQCEGQPFIFLKEGTQFRDILEQELAGTAGERPAAVMETSSSDLAHRMAAAGYGSTLVGDMMAKYDNFYDSLSYYPISDPPFLWTFGFIRHPERYLSPAVHTFLDFMKEHADLI